MGRCRRFKIHKLLHNFNPVLSAQGTLQIEGGGRTENVGITGFNLWNRILTESEIVEEANTYDRGMRHGWSHCEVEGVVQEATQEEFF